MSWRNRLGLDPIDIAIHVAITMLVMVGVEELTNDDALMMFTGAISLAVLSIRRRLALNKGVPGLTTGEMAAARIEELESRVADLEAQQAQHFELAERLDFAERLLARTASESAAVEAPRRPELGSVPSGDRP